MNREPRHLHVTVAALDHRIIRRVTTTLQRMGISNNIADPHDVLRAAPSSTIFCLGSKVAEGLPQLPEPSIVVCVGAPLSDRILVRVSSARSVAIELADVGPRSMLGAILRATMGTAGSGLDEHLRGLPRFSSLPDKLIDRFVLNPASMRTVRDICRSISISRRVAHRLVTDAGFKRAEHLLVALKAEAYLWLQSHGVSRRVLETYLGVPDRSTFRRACQRAGVSVPWRG